MHFQIVSPSSCVEIDQIELAQQHLQALGHQVSLAPHMTAQYRYLAGTVEQRLQDLKQACMDPSVDAIWCGRGGTGAAQLLPYLEPWILTKPIIGYSDSTVLLNYVAMHGGQALHAPVFQEIACKNLEQSPISSDALEVIRLLSTERSSSNKNALHTNRYVLSAENAIALQPSSTASIGPAQVLGGNLTVLCCLQGTAHALKLTQPSILMLEDVGEPFYRLERCLTQLLQSIDLSQLTAVVMGDFYQCPQKNVPHSIAQIFAEHLDPLQIPLYQCSSFGHGEHNRPFWIGASGRIEQLQLVIEHG
ncbi:murein tetrapeptidase LD-carboxypeptidase [Acinetobacter calcoaceticus]|uniref:Murein tetrapeptidase LD-carboxypeptidase n=1 Tax=Acinetobacter calcoaceticus TaxID=471 RepID=A0A4R1XUF9_ACICA|nr:murein tetrapeptidase LD-carboxypeptidase [Acinetobacter calcoaceticus]